MKKLLHLLTLWLCGLTLPTQTEGLDYSIIFVHLGTSEVPNYAITAVEQARLFNPNCPFYFIMQQAQIKSLSMRLAKHHVTCIAAESLQKTPQHLQFLKTSTLDGQWQQGFWRHATDRFFYIEELMRTYQLTNVFHIENDIMLYADLGSLVPILNKHYKGVGITFCCDSICIPGFLYIPSATSLTPITHFLTNHAREGKDDCITFANCKNAMGKNYIDYLPTIYPEYTKHHELKNQYGEKAANPNRFSQHVDELQSIFDGAALGQYLGGISPRNNSLPPGYVNTFSIFNPQHLSFVWIRDTDGRNIPYVTYGNKKYRINNLHIHSKNLNGFRS